MIKKLKWFILLKTLNHKLKGIGRMLNLKIDPKTKSIDLSVLLIGEPEQLEISIKSYELIKKNDKNMIKLGDVETSKTWLNIIIDEFVKGNEVEIPPKIANLLKLIL